MSRRRVTAREAYHAGPVRPIRWESYDQLGSMRTVVHRSYEAAEARARRYGDRFAVREAVS